MLGALLLASHLAAHSCLHHGKRTHHAACVKTVAGDPTLVEEKALRRRAARLAYLERRAALLEAFLTRAATEAPAFMDTRVARLAGVDVGPTLVTRDFLGSPVLRVRLRNAGAPASILLTARMRSRNGSLAEASTAVERINTGESRNVELTYPGELAPASVEWGVMRL